MEEGTFLARNQRGIRGELAPEFVRRGRLVAVALSSREWPSMSSHSSSGNPSPDEAWRRNHMILASLAPAARRVGPPVDFDDDGH